MCVIRVIYKMEGSEPELLVSESGQRSRFAEFGEVEMIGWGEGDFSSLFRYRN